MREAADLTADLHRSATRDGVYWHVVLALVFLRRERPLAWRDLVVSLNESSRPTDRLADTFADTGLVESARVARRLADVQPAVWHALGRAIHILDGVGVESSDLIGIFDHALDQLGDGMSGQFFTPRSVARLIAELVGPITAGSRCLDPFSRAGELLVEVAVASGGSPPLVVRASHPESTLVELAEMNLVMHGAGATVSKSELGSLAMAAMDRFDIVVSNPPFGLLSDAEVGGMRRRYGPSRRKEFNWLQLAVESLDENGRGAVIMPNGAASTLAPREREIRRGLVEDGALAAVVALPTQLFGGTSIGVALWLVRRPSRRREDVLFIDAQTLGGMSTRTRRQLAPHDIEEVSQEYRRWLSVGRTDRKFVPRVGFSATATATAIADQNYSLFPPSYVQPESVATGHPSDADFSELTSELIQLTNVARGIDADVHEMLRGLGQR
ncbi:class I SAM-dependent DNA methyltransferase [Micromonospora sp. D93]|uniref:HsdM family class I SAM-dependent methyltransferase n=1 Tax=Micromonospora sp. D93 TaxID=2824886 RepID=UPI001B39BCEE|nr:N-6 DNA methylase [Micromonospora sp. D93]